jgi:hypothetical protein
MPEGCISLASQRGSNQSRSASPERARFCNGRLCHLLDRL